MSARILIIDSRQGEAAQLQEWLSGHFHTEVEHGFEAGWQRLASETWDAVLLEDGLLDVRRLLRRLERHLGCFLVLIGERPSPERALSAVMAGAYTYLLRPLKGPRVKAALSRGLRNRKKLLGIVAMAEDLREANRKLILQKTRLQDEKKRLAAKTRQLNLVNELSCAANSSLEPGRIIGAVGARLSRELWLGSWAVLFAPPGAERAALFLPGLLPREVTAELGRQMLGRLGRVGGRAQTLDIHPVTQRRVAQETGARLCVEGGLTLPLLAAGQPIGLCKLLPEKVLSADLVRLAESAANMVALGLKNAGELLVARRLADYDALTRLANRRSFERHLRQEFSRSRRYHQPLTLIMADIDHFKRINDCYGHQVGDRVLARVGQCLNAAVRDSDFAARYGGEEFAVILPQTALESALVLAERIKRLVEGSPVQAASEQVRMTLSLGVADTAAPQADEPLDLVGLADQALYLSKSTGRNRISTWRDLVGAEVPGVRPEPVPSVTPLLGVM
jgi:diguanylate cyclase (GGDEF)-like protein